MYEFDGSFCWESSPLKIEDASIHFLLSQVSRLAAVQDELQIAEEEFGWIRLVGVTQNSFFCVLLSVCM